MEELSKLLGKVAPWLVAAAGGPAGLATKAIATIAEKLGASEPTVEAVTQAVAGATPEQLKALKLADLDYKLRMQELGFKNAADLEGIAAADRKSAREMQIALRSMVPAVLTWGLLGSFVGTLAALFFLPVPVGNRDVLVYMAGQLSGFTGAAVAFWLGTTRQSQDKTDIIARAQPVK